jgi:phage baseplate assembly protein gpV
LWFGTDGGGVSKFDGTNWTTYDMSNSGLSDNWITSIVTDQEGNLWFGTYSGGVSKFDGKSWTTYDTSNSGLADNYIGPIAIGRDGKIWFGTYSGVSNFDGTSWTSYDPSNSGLSDYLVNSIATDQEGNLWFGTGSGVSKFDGTNWITYNSSNSELQDYGISIIEIDSDGNIWFGTNGISMLVGRGGRGVPLWQKDISISQAANLTQEFTEDISKLNCTGKVFLEGKLKSSTGQTISEAEYPFYIAESNTVLVFSPDKTIYEQGEAVSIQGEVNNLAPAEALDLILIIEKQSTAPGSVSEEVHSETFSISGGENHLFSFTMPFDEEGTYVLAGQVTQYNEEVAKASEQYQVSNPHLKASVRAPEVVGLNPFDITIELTNSGLIEGSATISIQPGGFSQQVSVPGGETKVVTSSQQVAQTTAFEISFSGDYSETVIKNVLFGLSAQISVTPQAAYPEGRITIPFKVSNTGPLENEVGIDFTLSLNGAQVSQLAKSYYLPFNQSVEEPLVFDLSAGTYTLAWSSFFGSGQTSLVIKPLEQMEMNAELGVQQEGVFPLNVYLANKGYNDYSGSISIESEVTSSLLDITLSSDSSQNFAFNINPNGVAEGKYTLLVKLLRLDGTTVQEQSLAVEITKPQFDVISLPAGLSFAVGEEASFPFTLKNSGSKEGRASFKVEVMDMESSQELYLGAGEQRELTFAFLVPFDLPGKDYVGKYTLSQEGAKQPVQGEFRLNVKGIDINVSAKLDKDSYLEGEIAHLNLTVTNNSQSKLDLFAKVTYKDYEEQKDFALETSSSLDFNIPLPQITGEKAFYGIYHQDGRGIHLNDIYIYKKEEGVEVLLDKQVYNPGETANILINSAMSGLMRLEAPSYQEEFTIEGSTSRPFTLASDMLSGTYGLSWSFFPSSGGSVFSGVHLFDVAGLKVVVPEASLDKSRYSPGETILARIVFESNQDVSVQLKLWIVNPEGDFTDAGSKQISLSSSEHTISNESVAFNSASSGMHRVVYSLYTLDDRLIVSGSEAFDCGGGVLLGVSTEKRDYPLATEDVKAYVSLFGDGEGTLTLFINDEAVKTTTVALSGVTTEEVVLEAAQLKPGTPVLRAQLQKDNLLSTKEVSFNYGSSLADLTVSGLTYESANLLYTIKAEVMNQGSSACSAAIVSFYEGNPAEGGTLIGDVAVGALSAGQSSQVEIQWNGQGKSGDQDIYAVVDKANAVREFNEGNNGTYISLAIPGIFHELKLEKFAYSAYEDLNIATFIINNKETDVQGELDLKVTNISSMTDVWEHREAVAPIGPFAQSLLSNIYNLGPSPEGEYRISQRLAVEGKEIVDEAIVTILKTEKVAGTFSLEPSKVTANEEEEVVVSIELQNRGNVGIEDGALTLSINKKDTGQKVDEKQIGFSLDIAESKAIQPTITVNLGEGFYVVKLVFNEETLDEKELEARYGLVYTKQESLAPRVLILASPLSVIDDKPGKEHEKGKPWKGALELSLIKQALQEAGVYYKVETGPLSQVQGLRSGTYNIAILLDIDLTSNVADEIKERVWRGEGVIGILTPSWEKDFIREVFGLEAKGRGKEEEKTVETYATPISSEGQFRLQSEFIKMEMKEENLIIVGKAKHGKEPVITLNHYGEGRAVAFGFRLYTSQEEPSFQALKQILLGSFNYLKPIKKKDAVISRLVPVEMTFQNPGSSVLKLKIEEEIPQEVKLISAEPEPEAKEPLSWTFSLEPSSSRYLSYEVELPDLKGEYQLKTKIFKVEGEEEILIDTLLLSCSVEKTVRELILEEITEIEKLPIASSHDRTRAKKAVMMLTMIQNQNETAPFAYHKNLLETLIALRELENIEKTDVFSVRKSLIDLMLYYERRTVEAEKKMRLTTIVDLEKIR